jgi:hypothetical protein
MENYSPFGPEFICPSIVHQEALHNKALLAEKYMQDIYTLRRVLIEKFTEYDSLAEGGSGWLIFETGDADGGVAILGNKSVLFLIQPSMHENEDVKDIFPSIRILTNELTEAEGNQACITEDITITSKGSCQYLLDFLSLPVTEDTMNESFAPIFLLDDTQLHITMNYTQQQTPIIRLPTTVANEFVIPMGDSKYPEDALYALEQAQRVLGEVMSLEPIATSSTSR